VVVGSGSSAGEAAHDLASQVLDRLRAGGQTVAVAESLTGGLVAAALTDVPGSSAAFRGGVVAYATELKADLLGVDAVMLRRHGAVYPPVAAAMAQGVRWSMPWDCCWAGFGKRVTDYSVTLAANTNWHDLADIRLVQYGGGVGDYSLGEGECDDGSAPSAAR
jgi:hypothetical protein